MINWDKIRDVCYHPRYVDIIVCRDFVQVEFYGCFRVDAKRYLNNGDICKVPDGLNKFKLKYRDMSIVRSFLIDKAEYNSILFINFDGNTPDQISLGRKYWEHTREAKLTTAFPDWDIVFRYNEE